MRGSFGVVPSSVVSRAPMATFYVSDAGRVVIGGSEGESEQTGGSLNQVLNTQLEMVPGFAG